MPYILCDIHQYTFHVNKWVVDFMKPTIEDGRKTPFDIPEENRKSSILVNGIYPGPVIDVMENDTLSINVINDMITESTTIHWHGIHPYETPWTDGANGVSQYAIQPGKNFTYTFKAWPVGTHYWHAHMDDMQSAKGCRGAFIVKEKNIPEYIPHYDEERILILSDEWRDPDVCLKLEGAIPGNDVCSDIDYASVNGQIAWGNLQKPNLKHYPYPFIEIQQNICYRIRIIMMASNAENYIVRFSGHNTTLIALDGQMVQPIEITSINMHIGERADVILCGDQDPGYYSIEMEYDYACALTKGHFIPPGFHKVSSCKFYAFLKYKEWNKEKPNSPKGTGGGSKPKRTFGTRFDLTRPEDWRKTYPMINNSQEEIPDIRYYISMGVKGLFYKYPTDIPLTKGKWYIDMDDKRRSWKKPDIPILFQNYTDNSRPIVYIPSNVTTVEIVLNNLGPTAHNIHLHGMKFSVINIADYKWCNINRTDCFLMPKNVNPCPKEDRDYSDVNNTRGYGQLYWGCKYNDKKYKSNQNLKNPLLKDSFQVWQRSWAVIRFKADRPGAWQFHCHMEQHIPLGMIMTFVVQ